MDLSALDDAALDARVHDDGLSFADRLAAADALASRRARYRDDAHAAFHGRPTLRYGRVERRRGYRGSTVCLDCYYGRAWDGRIGDAR